MVVKRGRRGLSWGPHHQLWREEDVSPAEGKAPSGATWGRQVLHIPWNVTSSEAYSWTGLESIAGYRKATYNDVSSQ